mgnify:CR=1 FL=1
MGNSNQSADLQLGIKPLKKDIGIWNDLASLKVIIYLFFKASYKAVIESYAKESSISICWTTRFVLESGYWRCSSMPLELKKYS